MSDTRKSPAYPRIDLDKSIEYARKVYDSIYDGEVDSQTLPQVMGFGGPSGASGAAIGALKQFGLLEGRGEKLRISELAKSILLPLSDKDRDEAKMRAADSPQIYRSIRAEYGGKLPSDQVIRAMLIRKFGFSGSGTDALIKVLRETESVTQKLRVDSLGFQPVLEPAGGPPLGYEPNEVDSEASRADMQVANKVLSAKIVSSAEYVENSGEMLNFRISKDATVRIHFSGAVTSASIDKLIKLLEITKDNYE